MFVQKKNKLNYFTSLEKYCFTDLDRVMDCYEIFDVSHTIVRVFFRRGHNGCMVNRLHNEARSDSDDNSSSERS